MPSAPPRSVTSMAPSSNQHQSSRIDRGAETTDNEYVEMASMTSAFKAHPINNQEPRNIYIQTEDFCNLNAARIPNVRHAPYNTQKPASTTF